MHDWAASLLELQDLDIKVAKLEEQLAQVPAKIAEAQEIYKGEADAFSAAKKNCQDTELAIRKIEGEIATLKEQKKNFQSKSALIKSNDDYKAAMLQIELCDKRISELEDSQIETMDALEKAQVFLKEKTEDLNEAKHRAQGVCEDLNTRKTNCTSRIAELGAQRPALVAAISPELLSRYERLRTSRNNVRIRPCFVPIIDDACGRCRVKVTAQTVNNAKKGQIVFCGSCAAILYNS